MSLVLLRHLAEDMQRALHEVIDLYDDHLQEALTDASRYFAFPLSSELQESRGLFTEIIDGVETAFSRISRLVVEVDVATGGGAGRGD